MDFRKELRRGRFQALLKLSKKQTYGSILSTISVTPSPSRDMTIRSRRYDAGLSADYRSFLPATESRAFERDSSMSLELWGTLPIISCSCQISLSRQRGRGFS